MGGCPSPSEAMATQVEFTEMALRCPTSGIVGQGGVSCTVPLHSHEKAKRVGHSPPRPGHKGNLPCPPTPARSEEDAVGSPTVLVPMRERDQLGLLVLQHEGNQVGVLSLLIHQM